MSTNRSRMRKQNCRKKETKEELKKTKHDGMLNIQLLAIRSLL
jgi:hypothetical protein